MLPPFHGEALKRWTDTIAEITHAELDTWGPGEPLKTLPRMQAITLEVIQRVIFGSRDPELRDALRAALDMTGSTPRLIAMSLVTSARTLRRFLSAVARIDELVYERIDAAGDGDSILDMLKATGATREELRDQLVTLLAAGHETTATALAWALERLARHPRRPTSQRRRPHRRRRQGGPADPPGALDHRPPRPAALPRRRLHAPGGRLRRGLPVPRPPPRRRLAGPDAFDPRRFLTGAPEPFSFVPFGGGTRRCLGAAFATLEMREVLRAVTERFTP